MADRSQSSNHSSPETVPQGDPETAEGVQPPQSALRIVTRLVSVAERAAGLLREHAGRRDLTEIKDDMTVVTRFDRSVEKMLRAEILQINPDAAFLGEETAPKSRSEAEKIFESDEVWCVDPIDGTVNFTRGFEYYAISAGRFLNSGGELQPAGGLIVLPALNITLFSDGETTFVKNTDTELGAEVALEPDITELTTGAVFVGERFLYQLFELDLSVIRDIRVLGSTASDISLVVLGKAVGTLVKAKFWDFAGALSVAQTVGVDFRNFDDGTVKQGFRLDDFMEQDGELLWFLRQPYLVCNEQNFPKIKRGIRKREDESGVRWS